MTYAQHIFPNKLYECIPADSCSCSSYYCQEHKTTGVFTHISQQSVQHDFIQWNQWKLPTGWHYMNRISQCML